MVAERQWSQLDRHRQTHLVVKTALTVLGAWIVLFGTYYLLPFSHDARDQVGWQLLIAIVVFGLVLTWQLSRILKDSYPGLRAAQAMGVLLPLYLVLFAIIYLSLSASSESHFNEPLNHTSALYFAVTVFSSVGFGDISPRGNGAQLLVSAQMILDLIIIAVVFKVVFFAAKTGIIRQQSAAAEPSPGAGDN